LADRPIHAVVFDLDGLLVDSEPLWRQAEIEVFGDLGLDLADDDVRETMGLRIDEAVDHWWRRFPWTGMAPPEVAARITARVAELVAAEGRPMPGALEAVSLCVRLALPVAVCSGSSGVVMVAALRRLGLEADVAAWHSAEFEPYGKPHPGAYLTTAAKLGLDPLDCLAVEDSFNGAIAAKAARMRVVVVPERATRDSPRWGFCDARLDSLEGFGADLLERLGGAARPPR
jgi:mannitol-1-/sugar-/sorbitol-6-/2-deoxyglucose-6-phosphatase